MLLGYSLWLLNRPLDGSLLSYVVKWILSENLRINLQYLLAWIKYRFASPSRSGWSSGGKPLNFYRTQLGGVHVTGMMMWVRRDSHLGSPIGTCFACYSSLQPFSLDSTKRYRSIAKPKFSVISAQAYPTTDKSSAMCRHLSRSTSNTPSACISQPITSLFL